MLSGLRVAVFQRYQFSSYGAQIFVTTLTNTQAGRAGIAADCLLSKAFDWSLESDVYADLCVAPGG